MNFNIQGIFNIEMPTHDDGRGFFREVLRNNEIQKQTGNEFILKQVNHSRSVKNTLRGIHIAPWNKIIYVTRGQVQSVIVDCRKDSPTFGKYDSINLGDENRNCMFVPKYCGNSYLVLSEDADYIYLTDQEWMPNLEKGFMWNDPDISINWTLNEEPLLSEKDKINPSFSEIISNS